jgi:hypothetical protein
VFEYRAWSDVAKKKKPGRTVREQSGGQRHIKHRSFRIHQGEYRHRQPVNPIAGRVQLAKGLKRLDLQGILLI